MLRPNRRIVEPGRNRMRRRNLTATVLQHVRIGALQNAGTASTKTRRMISQLLAAAAGLHADQSHSLVLNEVVKNANRVRSAADTRDDGRRQLTLGLENLRPRFSANHTMKISYHGRIRM